MAVVIGEAAVRIRGDADKAEIQREVEPAVEGALEAAGESGADAFSAKMAAGVALAGAGIASGFAASLEQAALGDKLAAQLGASGQYAEDLGSIAGNLYSNAYGDSLETVNDALRSVVQSGAVMEDASNEQIESVTASVLDLATAFDQDVGATSQAVGRLIQTGLASTAEEALDIVTRGFQQGADRGGDLLDVLGEYGTTFSELGLTGGEATGLINQALAAGIPNADFAADALREMGIIGREAGEDAAAALEDLGLSAEDYFAAMQEGGPAASAALDSVLDALRNTEDPALRSAAATALVGTQYEDLGDAILSLDPSEAVASLGNIEGAAGRMGDTLNDNASTNLTTFMRSAQQAFVDVIGGQVVPIVEGIASFLATNFGPALDTVGVIVTDHVVPPLRDLFSWLGENDTLVTVLAYTVGTILVGALAVWGTRSVIESAKSVAGWFSTAAASTTSAGRQSASALQVVTGWVLMGAQAVVQGIKIAAVWTAQIVASAARGAASFAVQAARVVAGWVLMGAQAVVQGAIMAGQFAAAAARVVASFVVMAVQSAIQGAIMLASVAVTVAGVVAGWVLMGAQAMLQAARMAAAWFIALGPIGWVIAAVIGLVALIIANWETVKNATVGAFNAVVDFVVSIPGRLVAGLSALGSMIAGVASSAWQWFYDTVVSKALGLVSFVASIPGRIVSGLGNLGGLLVGLGGDLIRGLVNGISSAASFVGDVARTVVNSIIGFINSQVIDRINNLLEFSVMGVTINPPDIPRIPRFHSGGVFDSGSTSGEGLALLRDDELVATPEQRRVADDLLRGLLSGDLPGARGPAAAVAGQSIQIVENVYAAPGESAASVAARTTQGVVWNLNAGITRPAPLPAGA